MNIGSYDLEAVTLPLDKTYKYISVKVLQMICRNIFALLPV